MFVKKCKLVKNKVTQKAKERAKELKEKMNY
jgi:hypothetical protein